MATEKTKLYTYIYSIEWVQNERYPHQI